METIQIKLKPKKDAQPYAEKLRGYFLAQEGAIIAYSGGVDSALLAFAAHLALGNKMLAVLADSASLARREYRFALDFACNHEIPLQIVRTDEMANPLYRANQGNRCYYCKQALFEKLAGLRKQLEGSLEGAGWPLFYGINRDDLGDHRPGIQAGKEMAVLAPYVDLGIDKETIRALCRYYDLEIVDKPAMPCMSSRIAYGEEVTEEKLSQVEKAEDVLYDLGLRILRVRHHGDTARIEVRPQDLQLVLENRTKVSEAFHELGFLYASLDLDGFKTGSLNKALS
jgi:uncharacterized protein